MDFWIDFAYSVGDVNWVDFGDDDGGGGDFGGDGEDLEFQKDPYSKEIRPNHNFHFFLFNKSINKNCKAHAWYLQES